MKQVSGSLGLSASKVLVKAGGGSAPQQQQGSLAGISGSSTAGVSGATESGGVFVVGGGSSGGAAGGRGGVEALPSVLDLELAVKGIAKALNLAEAAAVPPLDAAVGTSKTQALREASADPPSDIVTRGRNVLSPTTAPPPPDESGDSHFLLRRGPLSLSADVYDNGEEVGFIQSNDIMNTTVSDASVTDSIRQFIPGLSQAPRTIPSPLQVHVRASGLTLDDIEAGSLRGALTGAQLDANLGAKQGEGSVSVLRINADVLQVRPGPSGHIHRAAPSPPSPMN